MENFFLNELNDYVNKTIETFHKSRINMISGLKLNNLISKNPYSFKAKNITLASELIESTLTAFLSSSEEKMFGDFLESLALYVAKKCVSAHKSTAQGIDLEFDNEGIYYIVSVKSGPRWGNSSQLKKLSQDFNLAEIRLKQSSHVKSVQKILGICYGKTKDREMKAGYKKIMGQSFWAFISNDPNLYIDIIEPVGYRAKYHDDEFNTEKSKIINLLTREFIEKFCDLDGNIDWRKLIKANSGNLDIIEATKN